MLTRRHHSPRPRRGFSLIEILVVISIIGVLTAITAGAMFRLRASQTVSNTEGTLSKIDRLVMGRWSAVVDQAKKTVPAALIDRCGGDKERATAIWVYATVKNEFPMTFAEAKATTNLGASLTPRRVFSDVANATYAPALTPEEESAALLFAGVNATGNGGSAAGGDGLNQQVGNTSPDGKGAAVYKDGWGVPILFLRHATGGEINTPPFSHPSAVNLTGGKLSVVNMLDPRGLVSDWTQTPAVGVNPWLSLKTLDPAATQLNSAYLAQELSKGLTVAFAPFRTIKSAENALPTLVSAGANKKYGLLLGGDDGGDDNLLSYRLRREGDRGN